MGMYALELSQPTLSNAPLNEMDDIVAATRGDAAAFERIYLRQYARVYTLSRRMLGPEDAEDAAQDIFYRAWTRLSSFRGESAFGTWLHRVAITVLLRRAAHSTTLDRRETSLSDDHIDAAFPSPDAMIDLEAALESLPPEQRAAVILHDIEGFSHEEVGNLMGISLTAARMRLFRARAALRDFTRPRA